MIKFIIDYSGGVPIYRQIIDQIRFGIASGQLKLGEQLPTVRALDGFQSIQRIGNPKDLGDTTRYWHIYQSNRTSHFGRRKEQQTERYLPASLYGGSAIWLHH